MEALRMSDEGRRGRWLGAEGPENGRLTIPVGLLVALLIGIGTLLGILARWYLHGGFSLLHAVFCLFFSTNLLIAYWELCLYWRRDHIGPRADYWRERCHQTGRTAAHEFMVARVGLNQAFSVNLWADAWAAYCQYDGGYADRGSFGFNVDVGNGLSTAIPTLILYVAFTAGGLPALAAGIIGLMLFWQVLYLTVVYLFSFFVAGHHTRISRRETCLVVAINSFWGVCALPGFYVSVALVVGGDYSALGF